jgi:predicted ATPase
MTREHELVFGPFLLDASHKQLWQGAKRVALQPQPLAVLHQLVLNAGRVVPSDELLRHAWGGTHVSRTTLKVCIRAIRMALGDDSEKPRYVETVGRLGYRFLIVGAAPRPQPNAIPERAVVGRGAALAQLERCAARAQEGQRQLVFVTGEPGIGKTTVVDLFLERIATRGHVAIGRGQCLEQSGEGEAYLPILEALGQLCRAPGGPLVIDVLRVSAPTWLVQMPALIPDADIEALQRKVANATRERMLREMAETLDALTAEHPLVLVFEDLHWSDTSTVELLAYVAQRRGRARLLLLATYRPVDLFVREHPLLDLKNGLQSHGYCSEVPLELLAEAEVAEYLVHRLVQEKDRVPQGLAHTLHRRTEGNPLFMVTLLDDYLARGVEAPLGAPQDRESAPDDGALPETIEQTIARQIAHRSPAARSVLEAASVAGVEFSAAAVAAGLSCEVEAVEATCEALAQEGHFLREAGVAEWRDGTVSGLFAFRHALYQTVLYQHVTLARRVRLHRRIAERQEAGYGDRAGEIAARLAVHFTRARNTERAVWYLSCAGENALRRSAYPEAIRQFVAGIELLQSLPDCPDRARQELIMQASLASALMVTKGRSHEIAQPSSRALELTNQVQDEPRLIPIIDGLRMLHLARADLRSARELAERVLTIANKSDDSVVLDAALYGVGAVALISGEFGLARDRLERVMVSRASTSALSAAGIPMLHDPAVNSRALAAVTLWFLGFPDEAGKLARDAVRNARELGHPLTLGNVLVFASVVRTCRHEFEELKQHAAELQTLATEHGFSRLDPTGMMFDGWALVHQQGVQRGLARIREGVTSYESTSLLLFRPWYLALLAQALASAGRIDEAFSALDTAIASVDRTGERWWEAELYRIRGEVVLASPEEQPVRQRGRSRGRTPGTRTAAAAEACFYKAIETARRQDAKSLELRATTSLSRLRQRQGRTQEAREALADVYGWFGEGFGTVDLQTAKSLIAELE